MKKRFNFYENEVLKKEMSKKEKRKYIEREDMLLLLQQVADDHENNRLAKKLSIGKYYTKDKLRQSEYDLKQNMKYIKIGYRMLCCGRKQAVKTNDSLHSSNFEVIVMLPCFLA